ncbi:threonine/serine ThrE exporter family protein [Dactylosporangium sp. CA-152071]|uniref:threonine/serine ThrE exporter family protein n=1 Tax=Dactylosporangium sp. CA-152071 TaxID=3239933 RepID=UPI003D91CA25
MVRSAVELASRVGSVLLSSGAAASEVAQAMLDVAGAAGVDQVSVDVNYTALLITHHPSDGAPYVHVETIPGRTFNYGRQTDMLRVVERFASGELTLDDAHRESARAGDSPGRFPWWLSRAAAGAAGASAAGIFGGDWLVMVIAFAANVLLDYLFALLGRHQWPIFFRQVIAGFLGVCSALLLHAIEPDSDPSIVVIAVIIVMLAGMTTTGGVQDAITGWYLTGVGRMFEAITNTIGLIVGVAAGLLLAHRVDVDLAIRSDISMKALQLWAMLVAAAFVAIAFSVVAQNPPRVILPTALLSSAAYAVDTTATRAGYGAVWSAAAAAFVAGAVSVFYGQWLRAPATALATCAILAMLPGVQLYQGMLDAPRQLGSLLTAGGTALALGGGIILGEYLATLLSRALHLPTSRFYTPLFADPASLQASRQET